MTPHPEILPGEKFIGNTYGMPDDIKHLKTARLGVQSYDTDGDKIAYVYIGTERIPGRDYKPLFIGQEDLVEYDRIRIAKFNKIRRGY